MNDANLIPPTGKNIPILDMTPLSTGRNIRDLALEVNEACKQPAFFYVKNHGIAQSTFDSVMEASKLFFGQPVETRLLSIKDQFQNVKNLIKNTNDNNKHTIIIKNWLQKINNQN